MSKYTKFIIAILLILLGGVTILYFTYVFNAGWNSNYFVKRDFNTIFNHRASGNCDEFGKLIATDYAKSWFERCLEEKNRNHTVPIKGFKLTSISVSDDKAFVQAELQRDIPYEDSKVETYSVNYELKRQKTKWFLFLPQTQYIINQHL